MISLRLESDYTLPSFPSKISAPLLSLDHHLQGLLSRIPSFPFVSGGLSSTRSDFEHFKCCTLSCLRESLFPFSHSPGNPWQSFES